ncbi:MAG: histone deacetylase [Pseudomonadota bacterium]
MTPLVHHPAYDAQSVPNGHRFPMRKYSIVADRLRAAGRSFLTPDLASAAALSAVHDAGYVDAILTQTLERNVARRIGFDITPAIARRSRAAVGGTGLAARLALKEGAAINLAGGSHHADGQGGAGFCVFNDVAVAAHGLLQSEQVERIAVVDLDVHHGDGTARIFANTPGVFTCSIHCEANWPREKPASDLDVGLAQGTGDEAYMKALDGALEETLSRARPQIVFYNAGVDPHEKDRLGLLALSNAGLYRRDRRVAQACRRAGVALCGVLGGGYSKDADAVARRHLLLVEALDGVSA